MVHTPTSLRAIAHHFDAIVLDQWGVLHNGSAPYPGAVDELSMLRNSGVQLAVLSNSGKRARANAQRLAEFGFPEYWFSSVMTSGEAFWQTWSAKEHRHTALYPITAKVGDAERWAGSLPCRWQHDIEHAEAVLLMGLPEGQDGQAEKQVLQRALQRGLPLYCTNPDKASPRAGGRLQIAPGALALDYQQQGGQVHFYGKPYPAIFQALARQLGPSVTRILMVGDSFEHDMRGAHQVGWHTLLVQGGLYQKAFGHNDASAEHTLSELALQHQSLLPDYTLFHLSGATHERATQY